MRAAIVLAAGGSKRFGRGEKLLAPLGGKPLLLHAIDRARGSGARRIYVVTTSARTGRLVAGTWGLVHIRARNARAGLSASLAAGLAALRPIERELLVFLGDMPFAAMPRSARLTGGAAALRPVWRGQPGHPMLVRTVAAKAARQRGDRGLAALDGIAAVRGARGNLIDIDDRAALRRARLGSCIRPAR